MPGEQFKSHVGLTKPSGLLHGTTTHGDHLVSTTENFTCNPHRCEYDTFLHCSNCRYYTRHQHCNLDHSHSPPQDPPHCFHRGFQPPQSKWCYCDLYGIEFWKLQLLQCRKFVIIEINVIIMTVNIYMYITNKCDLLSKYPAYIPNLKYWVKTEIIGQVERAPLVSNAHRKRVTLVPVPWAFPGWVGSNHETLAHESFGWQDHL